ncbi:right-handed parallel beta-helix repeat-containing protein [Mariniflexile litorale]|uniref:Right-handed parallel beta-helix repeat-containing protein n=1 Tax=Mariniflexile litorale TaxID=3045158 RepID=A0AAU7EAU5_9FLAO|nr:right-handed parallel beta-helix repeat-containing protein [Mariniflexile sp. KMM 9835]MDQ8210570.1 right-handed parallel beta-helix repeat-containing protein [Mariniflexile sp. KMM 9835]
MKTNTHNNYKLTILLIFIIISFSSHAIEIWVSAKGSDYNSGTKEKPLATLNMALRKARDMRRLNDPLVKDGIRIILMEGVFYLDEPVFIRPEDSGTAESPTIIEAQNNTKPVLNGGLQVKKWKKAHAVNGLKVGNVWVSDAPRKAGSIISFRQLWVNGKKAVRAKSTSGDKMDRILSWDKISQTCWIPFKDKSVEFQPGMEMLIQQWWAIANLRIKDVEVKGDSAKVYFEQPESRVQSEHPWPAPWISKKTGNSPFFLNNAMSLLDEPGEWFLDKENSKIYYYPRIGEDLESAKVMIPVLENLLEMKGTIDMPVHHVYIKGVSFEYSNWTRPSQQGHVPLQAGMYMLDAYKLKTPGTPDKAGLENQAWIGRPRAAVEINYANNIQFQECSFQYLSSTGLDLHKGTNNNLVQGNLFKDIGGSAINLGVFSDEAFETHLPYNPKDEREVCSNETIVDNLITNVSNEDWGCVGISAGFVKNITIAHNEISDVSYTGIGLGWGWTKTQNAMKGNKVVANKIHHYGKRLYDTAGIYTLSAQPESRIEENYIYDIYQSPYPHDPYHWFYLYTDEGSSYFNVKNNWVPAEKFLQNANGPDNVWQNNNAFVGETIKQKAGIRQPYKHLQKEVVVDTEWELQEIPHFAAIELVGKGFDESKIKSIAKKNGVIDAQLYQWKNHIVLYAQLNHIEHLKSELALVYPKAEIKTYNTPVYNFSKFERCDNSELATEWNHIVLTANLVEDTKLQQEYLDYHKTQFEEWPEVAQGFCNADFQQLQVFKNGRQLMLIISIPKGKSLDELNPKTTQDNPRVNDWNTLMKKYQTGIKGTKRNETWVFLNKLN